MCTLASAEVESMSSAEVVKGIHDVTIVASNVAEQAAAQGIKVTDPAPLRPGLTGIALFGPNGNKLEFLHRGG